MHTTSSIPAPKTFFANERAPSPGSATRFPPRLAALPWALAVLCITGCSTPRYQGELVPGGSLRLGEVVRVEAMGRIAEPAVSILSKHGIPESEIKQASLALYRVWCCRPNDPLTPMAYVPPELTVEVGDIVEIRVARRGAGTGVEGVHRVTAVVQKREEDKGVRWVPDDERLWTRVLYADWMIQQGWRFQGGLNRAWFKPPEE